MTATNPTNPTGASTGTSTGTSTDAGVVPAPSTPAQARLYQQLRGHLATLKLHTAAEHLPAILDHAAADGLSLTAALERLLALEVAATEARRLAGRLRFASLPTAATLEEFDYDAQPAADRALITELATCRYLESATNVLLIGPTVIHGLILNRWCFRWWSCCCDRCGVVCGCGWLSGRASSGEFAAEVEVLAVGLFEGGV
jgi:hypothetical protein